MVWLLSLFMCIKLCWTTNVGFDERIVGGVDADIEDFPYQVSLHYRNKHMCGGAILSPSLIITAAHCTDRANVTHMSIRTGSNYHDKDGEIVEVAEIIQHPDYNRRVIDYDVSLLKLKTELKINNSTQSIKLTEENIRPNRFAVVTGWGTIKESGTLPSHLQQVFVPLMKQEDCKKFYGEKKITDRMICAGYVEGGHDSCQGDSGGPLVYKDRLIGIVSWGIGCARPSYPGVYTSIPQVHSYLKSYL